MKKIIYTSVFVLLLSCTKKESNYKDTALSTDKRVDILLSQMTIEEKVVQLQCLWNEKNKLFDDK